MASTPTTKSQVQAYRFVLRRMQSALVRRDSVMLHDPMRSHGRATIVGFLLGMLGMVGFIVWGLISPSPRVPSAPSIVIGKTSGQIYVVSGNPPTLTPTFNLASARLLLMSQQQGGGNGQVTTPTVVPDDSLKDMPRGRRTGVVDGPPLLPTSDQRISDNWAVCDDIVINPQLPEDVQLQQSHNETSVLAGVPNLGTPLNVNSAILASADNRKFYLIYRTADDPNDPTASNAVRAEVPLDALPVITALGLNVGQDSNKIRHISIGLLDAIPEVDPLQVPRVPNAGQTASNFSQLAAAGLKYGDVLTVPSSSGDRAVYVVLPSGLQQVSSVVGDIIATSLGGKPHEVDQTTIQGLHLVQPNESGALKVSKFPSKTPQILAVQQSPTTCLGWTIVDNQPRTTVYTGPRVPLPVNANLIKVGKAGPSGLKIDNFYLPTGRGAVIQSATSADTFNKGPISLVTDSGLRYGIPNVNTAKGLGLYDAPPRPAPETIISLLPTGTSLNIIDAQRSYDDVEVVPDAGSYPSQASQGPTSGSSSAGDSGGSATGN